MTLFTLGVFLVGVWSLFFYSNQILREELIHRLGEQQRSTATIVAKAIDDEFNYRFEALRATARALAPLVSNPPALEEELEHQTVLGYLFNGGIIATGPDGTAIGDLPRSAGRIGQYYGDDEWVSAALREGKSSVGRPIVGKVLGVPIFGMTVPILGAEGRAIGTLGGVVALDRSTFMDEIATSSYGESGGFLLVAPAHRLIVTASDKRRVLEPLPAPGVIPALDRLLENPGGTAIFVNALGEEVLSSCSEIPASGWHLAVSLPTREAFAPLRDLWQRRLLASLLLTLLAGVVTWWMLRRQLAPLLNAAATLEEFSTADRPVQTLPVTRHDEVGALIGGFNRLLSTLQQRETALRENHEILRHILSTTRDGYWHTDHRGRLLAVNPTYVQQSGYSLEELLEMHIADLEATEGPRDVERHIQKVIEKGGDQFQSRHRRKDGSTWDVEVSITYRAVGDGEFFCFIRDITERKHLEQTRLNAQKLEALGTLAGGVAHDFNNMLGVILGYCDIAMGSRELDPIVGDSLVQIQDAAERSAAITRQLLAFARKQVARPRVLDLNHAVEQMLKMLRRLMGEDIELVWQPNPEAGPVFIDPSQLDQILANLATNARDAIDGVGRLTIETSRAEFDDAFCRDHPGATPGPHTVLTVSDSGRGIPSEELAKIFQPFYTTKPEGRGTGLGLATVFGIVKQNGGYVHVASKEGRGTTFQVYLPEFAGIPSGDRETKPPTRSLNGSETILLVEDEVAILHMAATILKGHGYTVLEASTPTEALDLAEQFPGPIDLLVSDVIMPHMNGRELAELLTAQRPGLRTLHISGYSADVIAERGILKTDVNFVPKPFTPTELSIRVREVLDGRRPAPPTSPQP